MPPTFLQIYADEVSENLDYLPTWPPDYHVKLGDADVMSPEKCCMLTVMHTKAAGEPKTASK
jgi:hypothetical protein